MLWRCASATWSRLLSVGQHRYVRERLVDGAGALRSYRVVATVPDWRTEHEAMTIIRVPAAGGDDVFRFHWAGDDVAAVLPGSNVRGNDLANEVRWGCGGRSRICV